MPLQQPVPQLDPSQRNTITLPRALAIGLLIASLAACAPWKRVDSSSQVKTRGDDYSLELPLGWVRHTATANDFFVTRDGPALNYIVVNRQAHEIAVLVVPNGKAQKPPPTSKFSPTSQSCSAANLPCASTSATRTSGDCRSTG